MLFGIFLAEPAIVVGRFRRRAKSVRLPEPDPIKAVVNTLTPE